VDLARSLIETGSYYFNFRPETYVPPGLPLILAALCSTVGCTHNILMGSMAVFSCTAFAATYELLRRVENRPVAAIIVLLLASSAEVFELSTHGVTFDVPYFLVSTIVLLLFLGESPRRKIRAGIAFLAAASGLLSLAIMIRTAAMPLLAALVAALHSGTGARSRWKTIAPILLVGLTVQLFWLARA